IGVAEKKPSGVSSERYNWSREKIEERIQDEENETRRTRFLEVMKCCCEMNAFNEGSSKTPSFRIRNKEGTNMMSFNSNGTVFVGLHPDIYGGKSNLDIFFNRLNQLSIFGYEKSDYGHWRLSKRKIEELSDKEFNDLKNIIKNAYEQKLSYKRGVK
ncbi:MAG: hypothetical protein H8E54_11285, partial [Candidatus Aminicenantes bacterium]|nr:hypothetical protein [Candidatus Aminicenantes bacterium]